MVVPGAPSGRRRLTTKSAAARTRCRWAGVGIGRLLARSRRLARSASSDSSEGRSAKSHHTVIDAPSLESASRANAPGLNRSSRSSSPRAASIG